MFGNTAGEQISTIKTAWKLACGRAGNANISTTSTYLAGTADGLDEVMARYERQRDAREGTTTKQESDNTSAEKVREQSA